MQLNYLLWVDDILLLAETEGGLNSLLNNLHDYSKINRLTVNTDKTKCMIFNKTGRLIRRNFKFGNSTVEVVRSYKYLGLVFTPSGEIKTALADLRARALKAYMKIKQKLGYLFKKYIMTTIKLFDSLVRPILLYASDFWGCLKLPVNNPIENLHMTFCKNLLGVQRQTTNIGVLLELGREPLSIMAQKACIKNWSRIKLSRSNHILSKSFEDSIANDLPWSTRIKNNLNDSGMAYVTLCEPPHLPINCHQKYAQKMKDIFHQISFTSLSDPNKKLRTYNTIKEKIGAEGYLSKIRNIR